MRYSKLKHDLEIMELNHKYELEILKMEHEQARKVLLSKCNHKYEDGSSAKVGRGTQWDFYYECGICGKSV